MTKETCRGSLVWETDSKADVSLPHVCRVVWLDGPALLRRAARISHGSGLAMADAVILASLIEAEADEVYTTDPDLSAYPAGPKIVVL